MVSTYISLSALARSISHVLLSGLQKLEPHAMLQVIDNSALSRIFVSFLPNYVLALG